MNLEKEIFDISLKDIMPNRFQPREIFEDSALQELADSIKQHGVIQPIIVRKVGDKYEIIAGERRFRASQLAGKETIPALVRDIDDKEAAKIALLENLQRKDLTPIEEAKTYQTILKLDNITQEELAQNLGKSQAAVANKLRLLNLDEEVQTALLNSQISERHARSLLPLDHEKQRDLLHRIINERLTVRQVDEEIMRLTGKAPEPAVEEGERSVMPNDMNNYNAQANEINELPNNNLNMASPSQDQNLANNEQPNQNIIPEKQAIQNIPSNPIVPNNAIENIEKPVVQPELNQINKPELPPLNPMNTPNDFPSNNESNTQVPNQNNNEQVISIPKVAPNNIENPNPSPVGQEQIPNNSSIPTSQREENIFDKLRVKPETKLEQNIPNQITQTPDLKIDIPTVINSEPEPAPKESYNNIYDLRFAINNFRQAVQNTEKFGFKVHTEEKESENSYQIIITIDKN